MIQITQYEGKWRITITGEVWEMETLKELEQVMNEILSNKEEYGNPNRTN